MKCSNKIQPEENNVVEKVTAGYCCFLCWFGCLF